MELVRYGKQRQWPVLFGYGLFIGMMATGYYYNVTFVQLGLVDLGTRLVGLSEQRLAMNMALLALLTCLVALLFGLLMQKRGWSQQLITKLRLALVVVLVQTILTAVAPFIRQELSFLAWIAIASGALGVGVPVTFSLTVDLIPTRDRGYVAAGITAAAYFAAAAAPPIWTIERLSAQVLGVMFLGTATLGILTFKQFPFLDELARQHTRPEFGRGRFVRVDADGRTSVDRTLPGLIVVMFGIYFVDSLGFLRVIDTPVYVARSWQSPEAGAHLFIAGAHVLAALIAGVLYSGLDRKTLFLWIFGIFALVHLSYIFHTRLMPDRYDTLGTPLLYATAVSLYTVVNFAIWADISTPQTISLNAALGVALSAWTATFISTGLALQWQTNNMPVGRHFSVVASLAMLFFLTTLAVVFFMTGGSGGREPKSIRRRGQ
ncbi:MAG: hypothetical protein M5U01_39580 [Ardenticatenaceae bacterium]|nr:hypothetical protein [Ardenticatenaceae bacterium]